MCVWELWGAKTDYSADERSPQPHLAEAKLPEANDAVATGVSEGDAGIAASGIVIVATVGVSVF